MARGSSKLTDTFAKSSGLRPGRHSDGAGLYLNVTPSGTKSWIFMWVRDGKRREMGLGAYPAVSLANARKAAAICRQAISDGRNPIDERNVEAPTVPTFGECADKLIASMKAGWRNEKHQQQWENTLATYCAAMRDKPIPEISTQDVLDVLIPIWTTKAETASRVRGRIERVLDYAKARGWRSGENPALWRGHMANLLPARKKLTRGHHAAMPYAEIPKFYERLAGAEATAARALQVTILTAARSGEVLNAVWPEFDLAKSIWIIPAHRMKAGKEHRVPLSAPTVAILQKQFDHRENDYVFPGHRVGRPLSNMAMEMLLRRLKVDFTVHGFRSGFRDWCGEETAFPRDVIEQALAHAVGDMTERAYRRGDALEKRRKLMVEWASFCTGTCTSTSTGTDSAVAEDEAA
ncbi:tyrosine-type recombinase/integrase [Aureimonas altamirensis]|uniref:tyrosine-type recombinase/integrase n=1 Tax=Aureimonas altamirensis TaxID=370622 RepID=UPI00301AE4A6